MPRLLSQVYIGKNEINNIVSKFMDLLKYLQKRADQYLELREYATATEVQLGCHERELILSCLFNLAQVMAQPMVYIAPKVAVVEASEPEQGNDEAEEGAQPRKRGRRRR
jgi:hypothetical protein